jgi:serine/threonine-protein kinase HipA
MIDPDGLNVWRGQSLVGFLWRNPLGQIGFNYDEEWLVSTERFPLSITLPLQLGEFSPEEGLAHRFFANLLPEGSARDQIVRDLKISNTDFDLLRAIGGECAGAVTLLRTEQTPTLEHTYQELTNQEVSELVKRKGQPFTRNGNERPRLSLAGAQSKCPVLYKDNTYWLPQRESPSSHILKFEISDYRHLPAYETFTMHLAAHVGLEVVDISLQYTGKDPFALIARYDRAVNDQGHIERYHQEDFCQALGYGHQKKYQEDGGATFADCYRLLAEVATNPAVDLDRLLRWQIFNVLAGNSDGHAKNLSLLYLPGGVVTLTPFYDLICTRAIKRIDEHLAFSIGGERNPSLVTDAHWEILAKDCGVNPRYIRGSVKKLAEALLLGVKVVRETFEAQYGEYRALEEIEKVVITQCRRALK